MVQAGPAGVGPPALVEACRAGPALLLYIVEPSLLAQPETDASHQQFIAESLRDLRAHAAALGARLFIRTGEVVDVLLRLWHRLPFSHLYAHEETGNALTYARDKAVARFCRDRGIAFVERWHNGVQRPLRTRDGWARVFVERMSTPTLPPPAHIDDAARLVDGDPFGDDHGDGALPFPELVGLGPSSKPDAQRGGEREARDTLKSFLGDRCTDYRTVFDWRGGVPAHPTCDAPRRQTPKRVSLRGSMSSPLSAAHACSRISPHLAWGTLSLRQAFTATVRARSRIAMGQREGTPQQRRAQSLQSFQSRLFWHSHFIQKLESDMRIEHEDLHPSLAGMRDDVPFDEHRFSSWCRGETGWPFVDACMRMLLRTGWLNFRMRAMLVSVSSYHLWLPWRRPALHLAKHFLDFEPGIHFSQVQMQSGTTGTNALRIYSPLRQAHVQDPTGAFIRREVPELQAVPTAYIHAPHLMPMAVQQSCGVIVGRDYPLPVVDEQQALAVARAKLSAARRGLRTDEDARAQTAALLAKHGSRKPPPRRRAPAATTTQPMLPLSFAADDMVIDDDDETADA